MERNKIYQGNVIDVLKDFPDKSVNCCVTSPPYWGLRDYGTAEWIGGDSNCNHYRDNHVTDTCITGHSKSQAHGGIADSIYKTKCKKCGAIREDDQLGLEETPEEYIEKLVDIFREVRRVLSDDGTAWLNLGDTYATGTTSDRQESPTAGVGANRPEAQNSVPRVGTPLGLKTKDLIGIPWRVALALQADGWYLRSDIIWAKPNPMPESIKDRPTKSHEYIFLLTKSQKYYYDYMTIMDPADYDGRKDTEFKGSTKYKESGQTFHEQGSERWPYKDNENRPVKNKRSVWHVSTKPFPEAHFAVYPKDLIEPCVKAGASEKGRCPKCKQQWTRIVEKTVDMRSAKTRDTKKVSAEKRMGKEPAPVKWYAEYETGGWKPSCDCKKSRGHKTKDGKTSLPEQHHGKDIDTNSYQTEDWIPTCDCEGKEPEEPERSIVLDPFMGSGTTAIVAKLNHRDYVGVELNSHYILMAEKRIHDETYKIIAREEKIHKWFI